MDLLKLAVLSLSKKAVTLILVIMELAVLFIAENYMVSALKERSMLYVPYRQLLNENSAFVIDTAYTDNLMENSYLTEKQSREQLLDGISGDYTIYDVWVYNDGAYRIYSLSDEIYDELALPLSAGSYKSGRNCAVAAYGMGMGEYAVDVPSGSLLLDICGNLTESTFVPQMSYFSSSDMTVKDFYNASVSEKNFIITNRSSINGFEEQFRCEVGFLIQFDTDVNENIALMRSKGEAAEGALIAENTTSALNEDLKSFIPLLGCILMIVLIGMVCISMTIFNENQYRNGILWICGYSRFKMLVIHALSVFVLIVLSLIAGVFLTVLYSLLNGSAISISSGGENAAVLILTCISLVIATMIIPIVKTAKTTPIEYVGRSK